MTTFSRESHDEVRCWDAPELGVPGRRGKPDKQSNDLAASNRVAELTRTIEAEIIPRLMLINCVPKHVDGKAYEKRTFEAAIIDELARIVVHDELSSSARFIAALRADGVSLESIFLDLLPPVARLLGEAWDNDGLGFAEVTIGLSRLQQLLRQLSPAFEGLRGSSDHGHRVVLMAAAGEQHSLGLYTVEVFFRRAGWDVISGAGLDLADIKLAVSRQWVDVFAVSKSCDDLLDTLASDIKSVRRASRNKNLTVMVGGKAFDGHPERVVLVGADTTASDGQEAVWQALRSVQSMQQSRRA